MCVSMWWLWYGPISLPKCHPIYVLLTLRCGVFLTPLHMSTVALESVRHHAHGNMECHFYYRLESSPAILTLLHLEWRYKEWPDGLWNCYTTCITLLPYEVTICTFQHSLKHQHQGQRPEYIKIESRATPMCANSSLNLCNYPMK